MNTKIVCFEGIIGAGKSTTIEYCLKELLNKGYSVHIIKENVDEWVEDGILQKFYENPKRYAYHFQTKAFIDKVKNFKQAFDMYFGKVNFIIAERSLISDYIFATLLYMDEMMDDMEFKHYKDWYNFLKHNIPSEYNNAITIYLKLNVNIALERIKRRNRDGEDKISYEYEKNLAMLHDKYFDSAKIVWDSSKNIHDNIDELIELIIN